jgi:hypothetical protein
MWIKHNKALYNTADIKMIEARRTKLVAVFFDGEEVIIGEFRRIKECEDILRNISQALLFEDKDHPGLIIKDTKVVKK